MAPRKRIGERLIEQGVITEEHLQVALTEQKKTGELLGAVLFGLGFISKKDLFKVLSIAQDYNKESVRDTYQADLPEDLEYLVKQSNVAFQRDAALGKKVLDSPNSPLVNLVEKIIIEGIRKGATDIHVSPDMKGIRVRYRLDGVLYHGMFLPGELLHPIVSRIKIMGQMNIAESRLPQDGSAGFYFKNREFDLRISSFPVIDGENIVIRVLDKSQIMIGLEQIGFFDKDIELLHETLKLPYGMILVTGPTGSGKTTTLYSCLSIINTVNRNIFTLEDPIEYQIPLARQSQINEKAGLTFASGLRSILRQDPDVILVGEMRDEETADLAVRAALTGHLVFSTLHTNDAVASITRIVDMGIDRFLIASVLETVIAQRLVRLLCEECKKKAPTDDIRYKQFNLDPAEITLYKSIGCPACGDTGFKGRTVIYEILGITPELRELLTVQTSHAEITRLAVSQGFRRMYDNGIEKVKLGVTTLEEICSVTKAAL